MINMAKRISLWREKQGLTQEDAARKLGVRTRTLQRWEKGECGPSRLANEKIEREIKGA